MDKVLELNQILDEEIKFCENFEELLLQKKQIVLNSKPLELKKYDEKIYEAHKNLQKLTENRIEISKKFGNGNAKLSEIISTLENKAAARELEIKRKKIQLFAQKITAINTITNSLIEHSLKLIDGSLRTIACAITATQTKGDYYNNQGVKGHQEVEMPSAIIKEA